MIIIIFLGDQQVNNLLINLINSDRGENNKINIINFI